MLAKLWLQRLLRDNNSLKKSKEGGVRESRSSEVGPPGEAARLRTARPVQFSSSCSRGFELSGRCRALAFHTELCK